MQILDAVRYMHEESGKSVREVGKDLGKSPTYLSSVLTRGSVPKADTLSAIADALGYDLVLISRKTKKRIKLDSASE